MKAPQRIVVFGATSAIAIATERALLDHGALSFFLIGRNEERLETIAGDLRVRGASVVETVVADLNDTAAHPALIKLATETLGGIDLALIAHGVLGTQAAGQSSYNAAESVLRTNFLSPVSLITCLANLLEQNHAGTIAVLSSVSGDRGRQSNYIYCASKAGLDSFLQGVRNRVDRAGVHVLTIKPGFVATPMTAHLKRGLLFATPEKIAEGIVRAIAHRRDVVYLPWFWRPIMFLIRSVPERIFKRLNL